jgi:hypothetical protein
LQVRRHRRPRRLPYSQRLIADLFERTETVMSQARCFKVCELTLAAQAKAGRLARSQAFGRMEFLRFQIRKAPPIDCDMRQGWRMGGACLIESGFKSVRSLASRGQVEGRIKPIEPC